MKGVTVVLAILVATLVALGIAPQAQAFHSGGVAECEGCHTMHNSLDGTSVTNATAQYSAPAYLLVAGDQSSTCLTCHEDTPGSYHISSPAGAAVSAMQMTPGGDFAWLRKTFTWTPRSGAATETSPGERHGHNIKATDYSYDVDGTLTTSPGGSYPAANLACSSCHDPHGRFRRESDTAPAYSTTGKPIFNSGSYATSAAPVAGVGAVGSYRLLAGVGYTPKSLGTNAFTADPPTAVAPGTYNLSETNFQVRAAYGANMSEWCANCHASMHRDAYTSGTSGLSHPAGTGAKMTNVADNYNKYVMSGNWTATQANSFSSLVPFEEGGVDFTATLKGLATSNKTSDAGPVDGTAANVMCLSCHRAHASGFDSMLRFSYGNEFMMVASAAGVVAYPGTDSPVNSSASVAQGRTVADMQAAYYNRPDTKFAPWQRVYCNKCHAKD